MASSIEIYDLLKQVTYSALCFALREHSEDPPALLEAAAALLNESIPHVARFQSNGTSILAVRGEANKIFYQGLISELNEQIPSKGGFKSLFSFGPSKNRGPLWSIPLKPSKTFKVPPRLAKALYMLNKETEYRASLSLLTRWATRKAHSRTWWIPCRGQDRDWPSQLDLTPLQKLWDSFGLVNEASWVHYTVGLKILEISHFRVENDEKTLIKKAYACFAGPHLVIREKTVAQFKLLCGEGDVFIIAPTPPIVNGCSLRDLKMPADSEFKLRLEFGEPGKVPPISLLHSFNLKDLQDALKSSPQVEGEDITIRGKSLGVNPEEISDLELPEENSFGIDLDTDCDPIS
jgi:hypothetical protein